MQQSALTEFLHDLRLRMAHAAMGSAGDRQLLDKFQNEADEAAFAVLVQRYGPMVLAVCRRVLGHEHEAEDAFQATFLVLVRKASAIRKRESLASWLHGVAHRISIKAYGRQARRRGVEEKAAQPVEQPEMDPTTWNELRLVLDEEIQRLPNKLRIPLVLCALQGKTHEQAAAELGCHRSSVTAWLAQANELLCKRLTKRGMQLTPALLAGILAEKTAVAVLPIELMFATVRLATVWAAGETVMAGTTSTGAITLAKEALKGMLAMKVKLVLMTIFTTSLALVLVGTAGYQCLSGFDADGSAFTSELDMKAREKLVSADDQPEVKDPAQDKAAGKPIGQNPQSMSAQTDKVGSVAFSPDGKLVASSEITSGPPGNRRLERTVALWDAVTGKGILTTKVPAGTISSVAFSPDGKRLAFVEGIVGKAPNGTVTVWDVLNAKNVVNLHQVFRKEQSECVNCVAFSPDSKLLAFGDGGSAAGGGDTRPGVVRLCESATGKEVQVLQGHTGSIRGLAFSPDGKRLASASQDKTAKLWSLDNGQERLTLKGHTNRLFSVAFSPDGKRIATSSTDKTIKLWDSTEGGELLTLVGNGGDVRSVVFSPDGKLLASAGSNGQIKLWDAAGGREIVTLKGHSGAVQCVVFSPDGKRLATAGIGDGTVKLWDVP